MTIKEAFEKLHKAVKSAGLNPFFLINNLKDTFKDAADNVEEGTNVEVVSAQQSGYLVGNIKVDGEDNYLFAPPQIPPLQIYNDTERLVAVYQHNSISENVYEITVDTEIDADGDFTVSRAGSGINKAFIVGSMLEYSTGRWMGSGYISIGATANSRTCYIDVENGVMKLHNQSSSKVHWIAIIRYFRLSN